MRPGGRSRPLASRLVLGILIGALILAGAPALVGAPGLLATAPVTAQSSEPTAAASLADCPAEATILVAVATASPDLGRAALVGDLAHQLAAIRNRPIHLLVGWAGAVFEPVAAWEQVTPDSAPRLAGHVSQAVETGVVAALDPTALLDQIAEQMRDQAARVSTETCSVLVLDPGESEAGFLDEGLATEGASAVVVASSGRSQLVADLAGLAGSLRGGATDVDTMGVCAEAGCDEGTVELELPAVLGSFAVTVVLPSPEAMVVVDLPRGASFPISGGAAGQIAAGSFTIRTSWPAPDVVRLEADVGPTETDWPGLWTISVADASTAGTGAETSVITSASAGVVPQFAGSVRLAAGRPVTVRAEVVDQQGRLIDDPETLQAIDLAVVATDLGGTALSSAQMSANPSGVWTASLGLDPEIETESVTLSLVATVDVGRQAPIEVVSSVLSDVLPVALWPTVDGLSIALQGDAGSQVTGSVTVAAGQGVDACAWIEDASVDLGGVVAPISLADGARSMASCVRIPADTSAALPLSVDLTDVSPGSYPAAVTLAYGPMGDEVFETVEIDLDFEVLSPINFARRVQIAVGMSLVALVVPLLALWLLDLVKARFRPARRSVAAEAWVAIWSDGSIYRIDTDGMPLLLGNDQFEPAGLSRSRRFKWRGLELGVRNPTSPLTPPIAVVGSSAGPVVGSMGAVVDEGTVLGRVPLNLASTWIFELEPEATREAALDPTAPDFYAAYGRLIVIRHPDASPVDLSELAPLAQRLALTVRRARRSDVGTAQEMLDFVDVNVSTPRDLPQRLGSVTPDSGDEPEPLVPSLLAAADPYDFSDLESMFTDEPEETAPVESDAEVGASERGVAGQGGSDEGVSDGSVPDQSQSEETSGPTSAAVDEGPSDNWDEIEAEPPSATPDLVPFGIVFEETINPEAFLSAAEPEDQGPPSQEPPKPDSGETADPRTSWARRTKPSWPTSGRDRDA